MKENNGIIIYQDEDGVTKVNVRFSNEDVWSVSYTHLRAHET